MPEYAEYRSAGKQARRVLTEWARGHVDVCCLKFHREYKSVIGSYGVGELHSDQAYQDSYTLICSLDLDENLSEEALDEKNAEYLETFPRRPSAALVQLIHDRCGTQKELSLRSGISEATISRMCSDDNFRYDIRQITRIVISLHMPPLLSAALMESILFPDLPAPSACVFLILSSAHSP